MRTTGVVRRIDDLGRIVIPKAVRKLVDIKEGEPMELFIMEDGSVLLKKYDYSVDKSAE